MSLLKQLTSLLNISCLPITVLGLIGNTIMLIIFSQHSLRKLTVSAYFRAMAVVNLFINLNLLKIFALLQYGYSLTQQSRFSCKAIMFAIYVSGALSAWYLVAAGIDRLLTIVYPTRFPCIQRERTSRIVILSLAAYNIVFYFHMLIDYDLVLTNAANVSNTTDFFNLTAYKKVGSCKSINENALYISDLVNTAILPFSIMLATSLATVVGVFNSRARVRKFASRSNSNNSRTASTNRVVVKSRDIKFTITMLILNVFFFITNAPNPLFNSLVIYDSTLFINSDLDDFTGSLFVIMYYFFYSSTFYVQFAVNSLVRRQFWRLVRRNTFDISIHHSSTRD